MIRVAGTSPATTFSPHLPEQRAQGLPRLKVGAERRDLPEFRDQLRNERHRVLDLAQELRRAPDVLFGLVGAGILGIYQLYLADRAGYSVLMLEQGGGVGGTWYWNRYPGCRFDSESYTYGYLFSEELWQDWDWAE